jgi:hypothetical protein
MSFLVALVLFVIVIGLLDRRIPWPRASGRVES